MYTTEWTTFTSWLYSGWRVNNIFTEDDHLVYLSRCITMITLYKENSIFPYFLIINGTRSGHTIMVYNIRIDLIQHSCLLFYHVYSLSSIRMSIQNTLHQFSSWITHVVNGNKYPGSALEYQTNILSSTKVAILRICRGEDPKSIRDSGKSGYLSGVPDSVPNYTLSTEMLSKYCTNRM